MSKDGGSASVQRGRGVRRVPDVGVRLLGTGHHVPKGVVHNTDLERFMDTSDEWISQRTGIRTRHACNPEKGENTTWLCTEALKSALADAGVSGESLDLVIVATVTGEMTCPSTACRVASNVGAKHAGAFDVVAACSGFVYSLNVAHDMIRAGTARRVGVIGCDVMTRLMDYGNRAISVLFGDSAGAAILEACDDPSKGLLANRLYADGSRWHDLYIPRTVHDVPEGTDFTEMRLNSLQMNGREVYKFAVGTFADLIAETLEAAGLEAEDVDQFVCHQSNARMLESARKRFGLPEEKMYINIDRYGNCSAGSVPVALNELRRAGKCLENQRVMFVAFGGGLTWSSSLWQF